MKIKINKEQSSLLNAFKSKERDRCIMNFYGVKDGYIYATDGRRCVRLKMMVPIEDGTYRAFIDNTDAFIFKEGELFPAAHNIMPDFSKLFEVCSIAPKKSDGCSMLQSTR